MCDDVDVAENKEMVARYQHTTASEKCWLEATYGYLEYASSIRISASRVQQQHRLYIDYTTGSILITIDDDVNRHTSAGD